MLDLKFKAPVHASPCEAGTDYDNYGESEVVVGISRNSPH
jgi:hypothetical protein